MRLYDYFPFERSVPHNNTMTTLCLTRRGASAPHSRGTLGPCVNPIRGAKTPYSRGTLADCRHTQCDVSVYVDMMLLKQRENEKRSAAMLACTLRVCGNVER